MEFHYKANQKIKIYLDKIQCALPDFDNRRNRAVIAECTVVIDASYNELLLIKAELISYLINQEEIPFIPPSHCRAIRSWYGGGSLNNPLNFLKFQDDIFEADKHVIRDGGYVVSGEQVPFSIKEIFEEHFRRFEKIRQH